MLAGGSDFRRFLVQHRPEVRQSIQVLGERAPYCHIQGAHPGLPFAPGHGRATPTSVPSLHGQRNDHTRSSGARVAPRETMRRGTDRACRGPGRQTPPRPRRNAGRHRAAPTRWTQKQRSAWGANRAMVAKPARAACTSDVARPGLGMPNFGDGRLAVPGVRRTLFPDRLEKSRSQSALRKLHNATCEDSEPCARTPSAMGQPRWDPISPIEQPNSRHSCATCAAARTSSSSRRGGSAKPRLR